MSSIFDDIPGFTAFAGTAPYSALESSINDAGAFEEGDEPEAAGFASMRAREVAAQMGLLDEWERITGTGAEGAITVEDVRAYFYAQMGEPPPLAHYYPEGEVPADAGVTSYAAIEPDTGTTGDVAPAGGAEGGASGAAGGSAHQDADGSASARAAVRKSPGKRAG